jgi:mannose-1-phosphate guanylyltransferase
MSDFYALIMAGGSGTRLWPLSRQSEPKQALQLVGNRTMFQHAVDRLDTLLPLDHVLVVTAREYVPDLSAQVPEIPAENFIVEPMARGTAAAIGLGALHLNQRSPESTMAVLTADHFIRDVAGFRRALSAAHKAALDGHLVTLGIEPSFPSTGFGYVRRREGLTEVDGLQVYAVDSFVEKPDLEHAIQFLESGLYSWNSGMFIWRTARIMQEFASQMPGLFSTIKDLSAVWETSDYENLLAEIWPKVKKETIDYGVMEHAQDVVVIPVDIGWTDIGDWEAVYSLADRQQNENAVVGTAHVGVDTTGSLIRGEKRLIATIGLKDIVIVDTDNALLVCARDRAQDVKMIVEQLQKERRTEYL